MNTNVFKGFFVGLFIFFAQACVNESYENCPTVEDGGRTPVNFVASNSSATRTSVSPTNGTEWVTGDSIGVYMMTPSQNISAASARNKPYSADGAGATNIQFKTSEANKLYYPDNANYKFISYYPYRREGSGEKDIKVTSTSAIYPIDVTDQEHPELIDVLYSDNVVSHALSASVAGSDKVALDFKHVLSKIVINIKKDASLNKHGMTATYSGIPLTADLDLGNGGKTSAVGATGGDISTLISNPGELKNVYIAGVGVPGDTQDPSKVPGAINFGDYDSTYQAIVIPHDISNKPGVEQIVFFSGGHRQFVWHLDGLAGATTPIDKFEPGKVYTFWVELTGATPIVIIGSITDWTPVDIPDIIQVNEGHSGDTAMYVFPNGLDSMPVTYITKGDPFIGSWREAGAKASKHQVSIGEGFRISRYQVTTTQYAKFLNSCGVGTDGVATAAVAAIFPDAAGKALVAVSAPQNWSLKPTGSAPEIWKVTAGTEDMPMTSVSWYGARAYAKWAGGDKADIPTEAQWEYAARADVDTSFVYMDGPAGNPFVVTGSNDGANMGEVAYYGVTNNSGPQAVGRRHPNNWHIYDMFGNSRDWTRDVFTGSTLADYPGGTNPVSADPADPLPAGYAQNGYAVTRGGGFSFSLSDLTVYNRIALVQITAVGNVSLGFRLVFK
jgi:formylglycine-generating enzyme required for sulfatase activity